MSNTLLVLNVLLFTLSFAYVSRREDNIKIVTSREQGFGGWMPWKYCNPGEYMTAIQVWNEPNQGSGDDTGTNMIEMKCTSEWLRSEYTSWGKSPAYAGCGNGGRAIKGFLTRVESNQGSGDDAGLSNVKIYCTDGFDYTPNAPAQWGTWGTDSSANQCEKGSAFCGFRVRIESAQGDGDDTGINAVQYACCTGKPQFSAISGQWHSVCPGCNKRTFTISHGVTSTVTKTLSTEYFKELQASISAGYTSPTASVSGTISGTYSAKTAQDLQQSFTTTTQLSKVIECDKPYFFQWKMAGKENFLGNIGTFDLTSIQTLCTTNPSPKCIPNNCKVDGTALTPIQSNRRLLNFV